MLTVWNGVAGIVASAANWFTGVWNAVAAAFAAAWTWVSNLFTSIWEDIKGVVMGFVEWLSPVIDLIIAPFKAIGNVIGGIIGAVKGWFGETADMGKTEIARMNENKAARDAAAKPVETAALVPETQTAASITAPSFAAAPVVPATETAPSIVPPALTTTGAVTSPSLAPAVSTPVTGTTTAGASSSLTQHLAAASRKGVEGAVSTTASDAFMGASVVPAIGMTDVESGTAANFQEAVRPRQTSVETLWNAPETPREKPAPRVFNIQNVNLNADDIYRLLDFARRLEHAVLEPVEAEV